MTSLDLGTWEINSASLLEFANLSFEQLDLLLLNVILDLQTIELTGKLLLVLMQKSAIDLGELACTGGPLCSPSGPLRHLRDVHNFVDLVGHLKLEVIIQMLLSLLVQIL